MNRATPALSSGPNLTGLGAAFVLTLRQHLRGRKPLILSLLFLLPTVLAIVARLLPHSPTSAQLEFILTFYFIPHALITLTALLYSAGIIQDEVEEQTLTYLLMQPVPRPALYVTKLAATVLVTLGLTTVFTVLALIAVHWGTPELWGTVLPGRAAKIVGVLALAQIAYCALFALIGLLTRWALIAGIAYTVGFEGVLANQPTVARSLTVMYYFRVLAVRWLELPATLTQEWGINLSEAPSASTCVLTLLGASFAFTVIGAIIMMRREFRMKTPEGS